jgi:predicted ATPase/class 3 adenylate cyclase
MPDRAKADGDGVAETPSVLTFFFSDIEGSTRLAERIGTPAFARVLDAHRRLVRDAFDRFGGREVSTGGDSFFAVFTAPEDALGAAVHAQRALAGEVEPGVELRIRIGLHVGHAVRIGDDLLGVDVNRAARVADAGHGGQVLISDALRTALGSLPGDLALRDLGRHRLKDVGPERLWQVEAPGLRAGPFPPPRSLDAHPSNLPVLATGLVGREVEAARLTELLGSSRLVTVVGPGGIGKTRLALEVAWSQLARFPDGVFHLELASVPTADLAAAALLDVLQLPESEAGALDVLVERLRDKDLLIVLDTLDRVAGVDAFVTALAAACPRVRILATSRTPLRVSVERELPVGPLSAAAGMQLFASRARAARADWDADPSSVASAERLVGRLDGIPLAIELAAARVRLLAPAAILDRIDRRLPALAEAPGDHPDRQRTLDVTIGWSHEQLEPAEQRLFARIGVFAGPFRLADVEGVAGEAGSDCLEPLERLVDRSLVTAVSSTAEPAFRLLGPIRDYALDALRRSGEEVLARERHGDYHLRVLRALEALELSGEAGAIAAIERVEPELRAALAWSLDTGRGALALELAGHLGRYWWTRGRIREGLAWLQRVLASDAAQEPSDRQVLATALYWTGVLLDDARRPAEAASFLERALVVQQELGDEQAVARTLNSLGVVARSRGELDRAADLLADSLERKRGLGDLRGIAVTLSNLGLVASDHGDLDRAAVLMGEALAADEASGSRSGIVVGHVNLGAALVRAGRPTEGLEHLRLALPGVAELGDPELAAGILTSLAHIRLTVADADGPRDAARLTLAAEELRQREGIPLRPIERHEVDDLLQRQRALLPPDELATILADARSINLDAALRLATEAAWLGSPPADHG